MDKLFFLTIVTALFQNQGPDFSTSPGLLCKPKQEKHNMGRRGVVRVDGPIGTEIFRKKHPQTDYGLLRIFSATGPGPTIPNTPGPRICPKPQYISTTRLQTLKNAAVLAPLHPSRALGVKPATRQRRLPAEGLSPARWRDSWEQVIKTSSPEPGDDVTPPLSSIARLSSPTPGSQRS